MSTHIVGFRPADDEWKKMKVVWDACESAGIPVPPEVDRFFHGSAPDERGVELHTLPGVYNWSEDSAEGFEVVLKELPPGVKVLRFYNSW